MSSSVSYTAHATAVGGRRGHVQSDDGAVKFDLSLPKSMGGEGRSGATNPEQLFASGYAACFGGALDFIARQEKVELKDASITADVTIAKQGDGFVLSTKLSGKLPGVDRATAERLMQKAHEFCPYSKATRGNMQVELAVL
ncbi:MAG: organic hydroperoxide resistance protein [Acidisphaera sp.]|nr:organic hydroperoxide resistance protein [Acidisphaera sp.]